MIEQSSSNKQKECSSQTQQKCQKQGKKIAIKPVINDGSMPSFIYYSLSSSEPFKKFINEIKNQIKQIFNDENITKTKQKQQNWFVQQPQTDLHLSISKIFRIYRTQSDLILKSVQKQIKSKCITGTNLLINFDSLKIIANKFIVLQVSKGSIYDRLFDLTKIVNQILSKWNIDPYFQDPIFHVTLFKINLDILFSGKSGQTQNRQQDINKFIDNLNQKLQTVNIKNTFYNCKQLCFKIGNKVHKIN